MSTTTDTRPYGLPVGSGLSSAVRKNLGRRARLDTGVVCDVAEAATAVVYIRAARDGLDSPHAAARQRVACANRADQLHLHLLARFQDLGVSGNQLDRPGLTELLDYVSEHSVDFVLIEDASRISRNVDDWRTILASLEERGTELVVANVDPSSELDLALLRFGIGTWDLLVIRDQFDQPTQRIDLRGVATCLLQEFVRPVQAVAHHSVQHLHLSVREMRNMKVFKIVSLNQRRQHDTLLPLRQGREFGYFHSRAIFSHLRRLAKGPKNEARTTDAVPVRRRGGQR